MLTLYDIQYYPPLACINFNYCTLFSPVSASHVQVIEEHAEEFLSEMNAEAIAGTLRAQECISENVECKISRSCSRNDANSHLLEFLKIEADENQIQGIFQVASTATGYGNMIIFATKLLQKFTQGLYGCTVGTYLALPHSFTVTSLQ